MKYDEDFINRIVKKANDKRFLKKNEPFVLCHGTITSGIVKRVLLARDEVNEDAWRKYNRRKK